MTIKQNDEKKIKDEIGEVYDWGRQRDEERIKELRQKCKLLGLDGNDSVLREISKECDKRIHDILVKYGYREK